HSSTCLLESWRFSASRRTRAVFVNAVAILFKSSWFLFRFSEPCWYWVAIGFFHSAVCQFRCRRASKPCIHAGLEKNLPPLTLRLLKNFVNGKRPVSTGFLRFFWVFPLF